jgi:very-short-patch-repair endonuclease
MRKAENKSRTYSKHLRTNMTKAEVVLWSQLKSRKLNGHRFNRQQPIDPYIADFVCRAHMLVVEVDGTTHSNDDELAHDLRRTKFLQAKGWQVLRIGNLDIYENLDGVLEAIACKLPPPPVPGTSPASGGGYPFPLLGELPND